MILIDTNLLLYAALRGTPEHDRARQWLEEQFTTSHRIGLPWHSLLGFVRLASNRKAYSSGPSVAQAWQVVREWLSRDNTWIPVPTEQHVAVLDQLFEPNTISSRAVMDIHLAALAIEHGLTLCSADTGFARYKRLRWINPLAE